MGKNSFSLLELLVSLAILAFISSSLLYNNKDFHEEFMTLNSLENDLEKNKLQKFNSINTSITITINQEIVNTLNIKKLQYDDEKIKLFIYKL